MPANPEFQELIIKHTALGLRTEVPEMQIYSLRHMKRRRISKNYIGAAATVTVSSGMLAAKLVIEELTLYRCFLSLS
jgi:hypothetical protein